jgi:hypothetical protein
MALKPLNSVAGFSVGETPANIILANGDVTTNNITTTGKANLNAIGNVIISGGSNGQVIQTDGLGNLSFVTISTSSLSNGNSNIQVLANGNITFSSAGNANVAVITGTGMNVAGYLTAANITATGNISVNNYLVTPTGNDLIVAPATEITRFYSNVNPFSGSYSLGNSLARWDNVFANTANIDGNVSAGNVLTNNLLYANGQPWDLQEAAGANTEIQYNDGNNNFGASANFTYNDATQQFTVLGNAQFNNANLGNLATANNFSTNGAGGDVTLTGGNLTGANVVIATSFTSNGGTIDFATNNPNVQLGDVANVHINGGTPGYILQTDGSGNLSWTGAPAVTEILNGNSNVSIPLQDGNVYVNANAGVDQQWNFSTNGTLYFPLVNSQTFIQEQRYGMGNLVGYSDGGWVLGEYNGTAYGTEGIRISPGIEGNVEVILPSDANAAGNSLELNNYVGNVDVNANGYTWTFGTYAPGVGGLTLPSTSGGASVIETTAGDIDIFTGNGGTGYSEIWLKEGNGILVNTAGGTYSWTFDDTGNSIFPSTGTADLGALAIAYSITAEGGNVDFATFNPNVSLGNVANVHIGGGSASQYLQTDGAGNLTWTTADTSGVANGTSNVSIPVANGNVNTSVNGNANVFVVTGTGANVTGTLDVSGNLTSANANLGNLVTANYANLSNDLVVQGNIANANNISITNNLEGNTANFSGNITALNANLGNLVTANYANFNNDLDVGGNIVTGTGSGGNISGVNIITANTFSGNLSASTANISGNLTTSNLTVNLELSGNTANFTGNVIAANFIGSLSNGTSNVKVYNNANVEFTINGTANVATISSTGLYVAGQINTTTGNMLSNGNITANSFLNSANANVTGEALLGSVKTANITAPTGTITISAAGANNNVILSPTGVGNVDVGLHNITQVALPINPNDAATKEYVDNISQGLYIHPAANVTSTSNLTASYLNGGTVLSVTTITGGKTITFSTNHGLSVDSDIEFTNTFNGITAGEQYFVFSVPAANQITIKDGYFGAEVTTLTNATGLTEPALGEGGVGATLTNAGAQAALTIDGILMTVGARVLVQGQTSQVENGIYEVTTVGTISTNWVLTRATDGNSYAPKSDTQLGAGSYFFIMQGSQYAGASYVLTLPPGEINFGTSSIVFSQFSQAGAYTPGNGIAITGTIISANVDGVTTDIVGGNIVVKTGANLTTPNLGDATFSSLTWNNLSNGNVTANNLSIGNIANITGNLRVDGIIESNGNVTSNAYINGNNASFTNFANIGGNLLANNITSNNDFSTNTANISANLVTSNATVNLEFSGNTANFSGNVVVPNLTVNLELAGNTANFSGNVVAGNFSTTGATGNISGANVIFANSFTSNGGTIDFATNNPNVKLGNVGNVHIDGGTSGYVLITDGAGNLSWSSSPSVSLIQNGTSNVTIPVANGNVTTNVNGNTVLNVTDTGANLTGYANISGNVFAPAIVQNASTYDTRVSLGSSTGIIAITSDGNSTQFTPSGTINLSGASQIKGGTFSGSYLTLGTSQTDLAQDRGGNVTVQVGAGGTIANTWTFAQDGNLYAPGAFVANVVKANVSVLVGNTTITSGTVTTTSTSANQTIASFSLTGANVTGVEYIVKAIDNNGVANKYSVATVLAVTDGTDADYTIYGSAQMGGYTGALAVNISGGYVRLQVTPASSNSTVWTTQYRLI